jgi:diguanylate cyclase (GGDEF)-like protein/PAS domain S-box-containing protein
MVDVSTKSIKQPRIKQQEPITRMSVRSLANALEDLAQAISNPQHPFCVLEADVRNLCNRNDDFGRIARALMAATAQVSKWQIFRSKAAAQPTAAQPTAAQLAAAQPGTDQLAVNQPDAKPGLDIDAAQYTATLAAIRRDLEIFKQVIEETSEGIIITDLNGAILHTNNAFATMSGFARDELIGCNPRKMRSERHGNDFFTDMWKSILSTGRWEGEIWDRRKDGSVYPKWLSIDTIRDSNGLPQRYVGISTDITKIKQTEENLNRMAFSDPLTGLPNRILFSDRFSQALSRAQRSHNRVALLYLDLDHFKHVNDSMGHTAGDILLREAGKRILDQVREADTVCRLGGDEFTVILEDINQSSDAVAVADKIIECLQTPFMIEESELYIGTSIGIALFPFDGTSAEELIKRADSAMYEAKEFGRGQVRFASGDSGISSQRRLEVEARMRHGLELGEFYVEFQPQVSAGGACYGTSSGIIGAEALVRWQPANGKTVYPDEFIEIAEQTGLIVPLGAQVLMASCAEAVRWKDAGRPLVVSVNVSQLQFKQGHIIKQVHAALDSTGLPPELLKLEITESLFSRNMQHMAEVMRELKATGIQFALDDFGTGYSSLRYLDQLPFDSLKIDQSFIKRIQSRHDGGEVATAIVSLARSFGMESIAEGVETEQQLDALRSRGCDSIQGYYVSKSLKPDVFLNFILTQGSKQAV